VFQIGASTPSVDSNGAPVGWLVVVTNDGPFGGADDF
jgi:hypothetical protein